MKFVLKNVKNGHRAGIISELANNLDLTIDTPFCMLYTRGGSAPHLSGDVLKRIKCPPPVAHMPLNILADRQETVDNYKQGIKKFTAMEVSIDDWIYFKTWVEIVDALKTHTLTFFEHGSMGEGQYLDFFVYCSLHDPSTEVKSGYNDKNGVSVWGKGGKVKLDVNQFMKIQEAFQPDFYQALSDGDTDKTSARKRCIKVVDRTLAFLDDVVDKHTHSQRLKNTALFGSIVGGFNEAERIRSVKETSTRPVQGFVIEGFFNPGPQSEKIPVSEYSHLLQKIIENLPDDKPRVMQSIWTPESVIEAYELGIDIFDSSSFICFVFDGQVQFPDHVLSGRLESLYPYVVTERGSALVFNHIFPSLETNGERISQQCEINLNDKQFLDDFSPLVKNCSCYCCQNYTRSYLNHLLNTTELLAHILLMIHNFHHYFEFFKSLRKAIGDGKLEDFKTMICKSPSVER